MSELTRKSDRKLLRKLVGSRSRLALLTATLGVTASVVASPTAKHEGGPQAQGTKHHWFQIGRATWYGSGFQGKKTATGEHFDMHALTCAHRTLPLGSWLRVTNLRNQKSTFVRVNDRGPMSSNLIVDLSYAAAQRLKLDGSSKVQIEKVDANSPALEAELISALPPVANSMIYNR